MSKQILSSPKTFRNLDRPGIVVLQRQSIRAKPRYAHFSAIFIFVAAHMREAVFGNLEPDPLRERFEGCAVVVFARCEIIHHRSMLKFKNGSEWHNTGFLQIRQRLTWLNLRRQTNVSARTFAFEVLLQTYLVHEILHICPIKSDVRASRDLCDFLRWRGHVSSLYASINPELRPLLKQEGPLTH